MHSPLRPASNNGTSGLTISLVVPCWKDVQAAFTLADKWAKHPLIREVVVAGVQSEMGTDAVPTSEKIKQCATQRPGRGPQMNLGAQMATGDILLFHHVDSILSNEHLESLVKAMQHDNECVGGGFYRKFDERHPGLR